MPGRKIWAELDVLTAADLNSVVTGIIARATRTTDSSTTNSPTGIGVVRLPGVDITAGRAYRIWTSPLNVLSTVGGDDVSARITYTTDGSTPTVSSPTLPGTFARGNIPSGSGHSPFVTVQAAYVPTSDQTLSLLLCVARASGSGDVFIQGSLNAIHLVIDDLGADSGATGVDV